ncbi:hypothetical protein Tco_0435326 [Tanacetum coccineum]
MLSLRERMELDLEARLIGETLVINRSLDPFLEDYIELNDLNEPFKLRRNQGNDLIPTIEEGKVVEEFRTRNEDLDTGIDDYPSYCDDDNKIHIDCAHNLKFTCMIGFEFTHANFSRYFLENMDAYRDEGMGDVIFGEPFLREVDIKAKQFEGMITLYKEQDLYIYVAEEDMACTTSTPDIETNQLTLEDKIRVLSSELENTTNLLKNSEKVNAEMSLEKQDLQAKLENERTINGKRKESSKNMNKLINSSMSSRSKFGLGFGETFRLDEVFDPSAPSIFDTTPGNVEGKPLYNRFVKTDRMKAVPPPLLGNYIPLSDPTDLDESQMTYGPKQTYTSDSEPKTIDLDSCESNSSVESLESMPKHVIIEPKTSEYASCKSNFSAESPEFFPKSVCGKIFVPAVSWSSSMVTAVLVASVCTGRRGNDEVTYQMVRSHPRFKHHTNEQCNKIPPLLKVCDKDEMNGVSHAYQKLKGFYKGVLNLGPDYIRNEKTEEWLTRGGTSACMSWIKKEDEEKSNLKTLLSAVSIRRILGNGYGVSTSCTVLGHRERNIDEYWWRIYESRDLEVLES